LFELNVVLLSPEAVFEPLAEAAHCIVIASGTLAPTALFAAELGTAFNSRALSTGPVEAPHVVEPRQLGLLFAGKSRGGIDLKCIRENMEQRHFVQQLGHTLLHLISAMPGGVLVFVPSRATLGRALEFWREPGQGGSPSLLDELRALKGHVVAEGEGSERGQALIQHESAVRTQGSAVLFCVYRGPASEGMSLSDHAVRGVVCVGIPLPPLLPAVRLRRGYNNAIARSQGATGSRTSARLDGDAWYNLHAHRAINQALGRVIRHRQDYGAIVLVDSRWTEKGSLRAVKYLPFWLRQLVGLQERFRGEALACPFDRLASDLRRHFYGSADGQAMHSADDVGANPRAVEDQATALRRVRRRQSEHG